MSDLKAELRKTFAATFGPQIEENENDDLGNHILADLQKYGFGFQDSRRILVGSASVDLPKALTADIKRYQETAAKIEAADQEYEQGQVEAEEAKVEQVAKAYVKRTANERLESSDISLLIGFGFGEETGTADDETQFRGWRFVEGLTPRQIAERTGTHESNWRNKAASGEVPAVKVGKQWVLPAYLAGEEDYLQVVYAETAQSK